MKFVEEINKEIRLVKIAIDKTKSDFLKTTIKNICKGFIGNVIRRCY